MMSCALPRTVPRSRGSAPSGPVGPGPNSSVAPVRTSSRRTCGQPGLRSSRATTSATSTSRIGIGRSLNEAPTSRSTAWIHTSRARFQGTAVTGISTPCGLRTVADQAFSGIARTASASRSEAATTSARISSELRPAPASMSASRDAGSG